MAGVGGEGVQHFYLPLFLLLPVVVGAHIIGNYAGHLRINPRVRRFLTPQWARSLYPGSARFAVQPHPKAGTYVLLPSEPFALGFLATLWAVVIYLFASVDSSPFIYFRF